MSISVILGLAILAGFTAYMFLVYKRIKNAPEVATNEKIIILTEAEFEKKYQNRSCDGRFLGYMVYAMQNDGTGIE